MRWLVVAAVLSIAGTARGQAVCWSARDGMPVGPIQAPLLDGELGLARRLCPRTEIALGGNGLVLADLESFYGNVRASGVLWESWALSDRTELFATLEAVRYQTVISSIDAEHVGPGHLSFGATHAIQAQGEIGWGLSTRLVLPTAAMLYDHAWPFGVDVMVIGEWQMSDEFRVHARAGVLGTVALSNGPSEPRAAALLGFGYAWRIFDALALAFELDSSFGHTASLDYVTIAAAVRLGMGPRGGTEIGVSLPVAGRERALLAAGLRLSWRL